MMMTKPAPVAPEPQERPKVAPRSGDAVADLERRLANLGNPSLPADTTPAAVEIPPPAAPAAAAAATVPGLSGKNALLARIMAAQERSKAPAAPSASTDAPPSFDSVLLPPPDASQAVAPPAFDATALPPPAAPTISFDPMVPPPASLMDAPPLAPPMDAPPALAAPMVPSAPMFDDLLDHEQQQQQSAPPPDYSVTALPPPMQAPTTTSAAEDELAEIMGLQGLSPEERKALIAEQEEIMKQIGKQGATSAADAFEARSHAAAVQAISGGGSTSRGTSNAPRTVHLGSGQEVALHGHERTHEAIANGTACVVQCLSCENWMQVTEFATLMFCPVCQTVSPVLKQEEEAREAQQVISDAELAEQLQKEEYKEAERAEARQARAAQQEAARKKKAAEQAGGGSWMEWLGMATTAPAPAASPERPMSFAEPPAQRGYQGVSRPPGSSALSSSPPRLSAAQTDSVSFSAQPEPDYGVARVAEQKPLFSCVADSITSAASSFTTALNTQTLSQDAEGNVHGVDSSSLLAMPTVGRNTTNPPH